MNPFEKEGWDPVEVEQVDLIRVSPRTIKTCFARIAQHISADVVDHWTDSRFTMYYTSKFRFNDGTTTEMTLTPTSTILLLKDGKVQIL